MKKLQAMIAEYGPIALVVWLVIFAIVFVVSYFAIRAGWSPKTATGKGGTVLIAWLVTKVTEPFRFGATVVLTPIVAKLYRRMRGQTPAA